LQVGDSLRIRLGPYHHIVTVRGLSEIRGPAPVAAKLYEETAESIKAREAMAAQLKAAATGASYEKGRPTKKDRRDIERLRRGSRFCVRGRPTEDWPCGAGCTRIRDNEIRVEPSPSPQPRTRSAPRAPRPCLAGCRKRRSRIASFST
jgi:hypothetical protein